jgi:hypothetical protein
MGAVLSVLGAAAAVRTVIAIIRHAATGNYRGIVADILGSTGLGKMYGLASQPVKLAASAFDKGSPLHKAVVVVGRVGGPVIAKFGRGLWGVVRSAVKV